MPDPNWPIRRMPASSHNNGTLSSCRLSCSGGFLEAAEFVGFFDEGFDDSRFGDGFDDTAVDENLAFAVSGGDPDVGFPGLTGSVDDASHHGHTQWEGKAVEGRRDLFGEAENIDLCATARRAGDNIRTALAAVSASMASVLPRRLRWALSGWLTSMTRTPAVWSFVPLFGPHAWRPVQGSSLSV